MYPHPWDSREHFLARVDIIIWNYDIFIDYLEFWNYREYLIIIGIFKNIGILKDYPILSELWLLLKSPQNVQEFRSFRANLDIFTLSGVFSVIFIIFSLKIPFYKDKIPFYKGLFCGNNGHFFPAYPILWRISRMSASAIFMTPYIRQFSSYTPFMVLKMARRTLLKHFQQKKETVE